LTGKYSFNFKKINENEFNASIANIYHTAISYLTTWTSSNEDFSGLSYMMLEKVPERNEFTSSIAKLISITTIFGK
jgi:hypothetical protein